MSIKSLMIQCVEAEYTAEYIANVFWKQNIAQVNSVTLIPYIKNAEVYQTAYIEISCWCDSEISYNFIKRLNSYSKESRLVYCSDCWWPVQINSHILDNIFLNTYTTTFPKSYFIRGKKNKKYLISAFKTTADAQQRIKRLNKDVSQDKKAFNYRDEVKAEIDFIKNEIMEYQVNNSQNVTIRPRRLISV